MSAQRRVLRCLTFRSFWLLLRDHLALIPAAALASKSGTAMGSMGATFNSCILYSRAGMWDASTRH